MVGITLKDMGRINWVPTGKLALGRGIAASLVITIVLMFVGGFRGQGIGAIASNFVALVVGLSIGAPFMHLFIKGINATLTAMGLGIGAMAGNIMLFMVSAAASCGDPIIYIINQRYPHLFEVTGLKPFNFLPAIFVLSDAEEEHE